MVYMLEIEERIMKQFIKLFELYLGYLCYNSFVIMMDEARRRLLQYLWATFDCLSDLSDLDSVFGSSDRRSLDVVSMRVQILSYRGMHVEAEVDVSMLV
jgi:hypothetical protein